MTIGVTGATGRLGGKAARHLASAGCPLRLIVRDPSRTPDLPGAETAQASYGDGPALAAAFDGVTTLLMVSASECADRVALHKATVDVAVASGVERIVYTSFLSAAPDATFTFAQDHWHTEQHIRESGLAFTFLRNNWYLEMLPAMVGEDDVIRGPAGDGRMGAVAIDDAAEVAAKVASSNDHDGRTYDVTGPTAFTLTEAAEALSKAYGRTITYHAETLDEAYRSRECFGAPAWEVAGWVTSYVAIAHGDLDVVTDTVPGITGHAATGLEDFLASR